MRLVLLPGFDGTGMLYAPFVRALPPEIVPFVIPYPTDRICSANELLGIVLLHLPINEPYVLMAESFSGPIALKASALHQNMPDAVILCASFAKCPSPRIVVRMLMICGRALSRYRPPRWLVRRYLLGEASEEIISLFYNAISSVSPRVLAQRLGVFLDFDKRYTPVCLNFPLLYLQATQDRLVNAHNLRFMQRRYPAFLVKKIESPHLMLQVQPDASARAISDFLNLVAKRKPAAEN